MFSSYVSLLFSAFKIEQCDDSDAHASHADADAEYIIVRPCVRINFHNLIWNKCIACAGLERKISDEKATFCADNVKEGGGMKPLGDLHSDADIYCTCVRNIRRRRKKFPSSLA